MEAVNWMFSGEAAIDDDTNAMVKAREELMSKASSFKTVYQGKPAVKHFEKLNSALHNLASMVQKIEVRDM